MPDVNVFASGLFFPEAPRWHDGYLWLSDITGRAIRRYTASGVGEDYARLDTEPCGLGFAPDGSVLVVDMPGRRLLSLRDGTMAVVADLSGLAPSFCNDMVVAADGTAYVTQFGSNHWKGEPRRPAPVIRVSPDGKAEAFGPDLNGPNGIVLTPDERSLLIAEPGAGRIYYLNLDSGGAVSEHGIHAELPPAPGSQLPFGTPDGICLDSEGALWIADPTGNRVIRVGGDGKVTDSIPFADGIPLSVVLGGADARTLYIVVASHVDFYAPLRDPAGYVAVITVGVPGTGPR
jgi:sugar lactone lactonase YvrE